MSPPPAENSAPHTFGLEVDGVGVSSLQGLSGLKIERDVIEVKQTGPDGTSIIRRLPGNPQSAEVTVSRLLGEDRTFERWVSERTFGAGGPGGSQVTVVVFDAEGRLLRRYRLVNAWPRALEIASGTAGDLPVASEKLVVSCDGVEVV